MQSVKQNEKLYLIECGLGSKWLNTMVDAAVADGPYERLAFNDLTFEKINGGKVLLAYDLNVIGGNHEMNSVLEKLHQMSIGAQLRFKNTLFALLVTSPSDQFTKSSARSVVFLLNAMGGEFLGHPIVEATHGLENLSKWRKNLGLPEEQILRHLSRVLGEKMRAYGERSFNALEPEEEHAQSIPFNQSGKGTLEGCRKITVIHASDRKTSNTLLLWDMVRPGLKSAQVKEVYLEHEVLNDCRGCLFETCLRFSEQKRCFYDDVITQSVLPAIEEADVVVWICPNYNDTIGARMMAVINRLTVLYRRAKLDHKLMYAMVVSGNSGGDCVASQLIGALNINKGFHLPPSFALIETANAPRSILSVKDVDIRAEAFASAMNTEIEDFCRKVNRVE